MPQAQPAKPTRGKASQLDAIALLKADHAEVDEMFKEYESNKEKADAGRKKTLAAKICKALTVHATIEEEIFYPACEEIDDVDELLAEASVDHESLKRLIADIEAGEAGSEEFDANVKVLGEYVKHHVKEEQDELFPKVKESDLDLDELGSQLASRKAELSK